MPVSEPSSVDQPRRIHWPFVEDAPERIVAWRGGIITGKPRWERAYVPEAEVERLREALRELEHCVNYHGEDIRREALGLPLDRDAS